HPSNFGPSFSGRTRKEKAIALFGAAAMVADYAGLARFIRKHRISVLHSTDRPRDAVACSLLAKMTGAKSIIHVHVTCGDWRSRAVRWAMDSADALVGVSQFVARSLVDGGYEAQKTRAVLNAIDPAAWDYCLEASHVRQALGIPDAVPVVAC